MPHEASNTPCALHLRPATALPQVMHSDLKASNVLLDAGWTVAKLGDVGVAKCMANNDNGPASGWTLAYAAPELLISNDFDKSVSAEAAALSSNLPVMHLMG